MLVAPFGCGGSSTPVFCPVYRLSRGVSIISVRICIWGRDAPRHYASHLLANAKGSRGGGGQNRLIGQSQYSREEKGNRPLDVDLDAHLVGFLRKGDHHIVSRQGHKPELAHICPASHNPWRAPLREP